MSHLLELLLSEWLSSVSQTVDCDQFHGVTWCLVVLSSHCSVLPCGAQCLVVLSAHCSVLSYGVLWCLLPAGAPSPLLCVALWRCPGGARSTLMVPWRCPQPTGARWCLMVLDVPWYPVVPSAHWCSLTADGCGAC